MTRYITTKSRKNKVFFKAEHNQQNFYIYKGSSSECYSRINVNFYKLT